MKGAFGMALALCDPLPDLSGAGEWINGQATRDSLRGRPVLVHFWAVSCELCKEGLSLLPFLQDVHGAATGLALIGIHTPRLPPDRDIGNIRAAAAMHGLAHPVLADNGAAAKAFGNAFVPAYYLFDETHRLRHFQAGEHALRAMERRLAKLAAHPEPTDAGESEWRHHHAGTSGTEVQ